jgi:hypothetical protein
MNHRAAEQQANSQHPGSDRQLGEHHGFHHSLCQCGYLGRQDGNHRPPTALSAATQSATRCSQLAMEPEQAHFLQSAGYEATYEKDYMSYTTCC